jgi:hypothetical protein
VPYARFGQIDKQTLRSRGQNILRAEVAVNIRIRDPENLKTLTGSFQSSSEFVELAFAQDRWGSLWLQLHDFLQRCQKRINSAGNLIDTPIGAPEIEKILFSVNQFDL